MFFASAVRSSRERGCIFGGKIFCFRLLNCGAMFKDHLTCTETLIESLSVLRIPFKTFFFEFNSAAQQCVFFQDNSFNGTPLSADNDGGGAASQVLALNIQICCWH